MAAHVAADQLVEMKAQGLPHSTRKALADFWNEERFRPIREMYDLPHQDLKSLVSCLVEMAAGSRELHAPELWREIGTFGLDPLAKQDRFAACFPGLYALASLEGSEARGLVLPAWQGEYPDWSFYALCAAWRLFDAGCLAAARFVAERGRGLVEKEFPSPWSDALHFEDIVASHEQLLRRIQIRVDDALADFAWDLRKACSINEPNFRAELSAVLWVLGDVLQAELLSADGEPRYRPSARYLIEIVTVSLSRIPSDPFLQHIWLEMKNRPPIDLRSHVIPFHIINTRYYVDSSISLVDNTFGEPSRIFASAAIEDSVIGASRTE